MILFNAHHRCMRLVLSVRSDMSVNSLPQTLAHRLGFINEKLLYMPILQMIKLSFGDTWDCTDSEKCSLYMHLSMLDSKALDPIY